MAAPCGTIEAGLLPLKIDSGAARQELTRASLLVESIAHYWRGRQPFRLFVVCPDDEIDIARGVLEPLGGESLRIEFLGEEKFFPRESAFHTVSGMYKQQLVKLRVPAVLEIGGFITFDADVVCLREFNETAFLREGRIISKWERKHIHSWWENSMSGLRAWTDLGRHGFGVTPNTLHSAICAQIFDYLALRGLSPIDYLCDLTRNHPHMKRLENESMPLSWSEYSLYTIVGEWFSSLGKYHLSLEEAVASKVNIHSNRNIWSKKDMHRMESEAADDGYFLIVQSWVGINVGEIKEKMKVFSC